MSNQLSRAIKGARYMHATKGECRLIGPDPEDGALLILERIGDDSVLGEYFGCEHSDLRHIGPKLGTPVCPANAVRIGEIITNEAGQVTLQLDDRKTVFDYSGSVIYAAPKAHG